MNTKARAARYTRDPRGNGWPEAAVRTKLDAGVSGMRRIIHWSQKGYVSTGKNVPHRNAMGVMTKVVSIPWSA